MSMLLKSRDMNYDSAMEQAAHHIQYLNESLSTVGFGKDDVKTTQFNVSTEYNNVKDQDGNYHREFAGYLIKHDLKLGFDFDMEKLSQALSAIAECLSTPELSIEFTVKDTTAIREEILRSATANARRKAVILCEASGVDLGQLLSIDYNWSELKLISRTKYKDNYVCAPQFLKAPDIEPEDIDVSDTATFVWEIK